MWIAMNDSFVSIVADKNDEDQLVVRARVREDLEALFPVHAEDIIETDDSDYQFRLFLDRQYVAVEIAWRIDTINYYNFKDSVKQSWRSIAYMKIWRVMWEVQESIAEKASDYIPWWQNYRYGHHDNKKKPRI